MFNANGNYQLITEHKTYNVGIYTRLSREDEPKDGEKRRADEVSESISNQLTFLNQYAYSQGWNVVGEYVDDGTTGGNFDRTAFKRLLEDIEVGKVNTVLVKDLSRFARTSEANSYIDTYFPERQVRFIAINNGVDTFMESSNNDMAGLWNWFNEQFLRDTSKKIKQALHTKKHQGLYTAPYAPYGYRKDEEDKHRLVVDEPAAEVVKRVFDMYTSGVPMQRISTILNQEGVPSKSEHKRKTLKKYNGKGWSGMWEQNAIRDILISPMYLGHMTQGRERRASFKSKKLIRNPVEQWIIVEDKHEPIIDQATFDTAQLLLSKNQAKDISNDGSLRLLNGLLYCGDCGERVYLTPARGQKWHSICSSYRRFKKCRSHRIQEVALNEYVLGELQRISKAIVDSKALASKLKDNAPKREAMSHERELARINKRIDDMSQYLVKSYMDKSDGKLTEDQFLTIRDTITSQREELINQREDVQLKLQTKKDNLLDHEKIIQELLTFDVPSRAIIAQLVERITIYHHENDNREVVIQYAFPNPLEE
jgi:DNA invertase Pin-like site-specific DNA recombinase